MPAAEGLALQNRFRAARRRVAEASEELGREAAEITRKRTMSTGLVLMQRSNIIGGLTEQMTRMTMATGIPDLTEQEWEHVHTADHGIGTSLDEFLTKIETVMHGYDAAMATVRGQEPPS